MKDVYLVEDMGGVAFAVNNLDDALKLSSSMHCESTAELFVKTVPLVENQNWPWDDMPKPREVQTRAERA